jgi:hypothetical protein
LGESELQMIRDRSTVVSSVCPSGDMMRDFLRVGSSVLEMGDWVSGGSRRWRDLGGALKFRPLPEVTDVQIQGVHPAGHS